MKYFLQLEGNEKLFVKIIIIAQIIITILLITLLMIERPIDLYLEPNNFNALCQNVLLET